MQVHSAGSGDELAQQSREVSAQAIDRAYYQLKLNGDLQRYEADRALHIQLNERPTTNLGLWA